MRYCALHRSPASGRRW